LGLAGLFQARRSRERADHVAMAVLVSGLALAALSRKQSIQYLYPALPALFYFGTSSIRRALEGARWKLAAVSALIAVGAVTNLAKGVSAAFTPSTTELARRWIYHNVPPGSEVALETNYVPRLFSDATLARIESDRLKGGPRVAAFLRSRHPRYR